MYITKPMAKNSFGARQLRVMERAELRLFQPSRISAQQAVVIGNVGRPPLYRHPGLHWRICCAMKTAKRVSPGDVDAVAIAGDGAGVKEISAIAGARLAAGLHRRAVRSRLLAAIARRSQPAMGGDPAPAPNRCCARPIWQSTTRLQVDHFGGVNAFRPQCGPRVPAA